MGSPFFNFALKDSLLPKMDIFSSIFFFTGNFMKIDFFWQKAALYNKIQESRPHFKLNFTTSEWSHPYTPFLCVVMVLVWLLSYFYTFLPCNWQFAAQFSYHCKPLIFQHYVKCDTSRQKWRKWREKCTGRNLDLTHFKGS